MADRDSKGRLKKGHSKPGPGRPKKDVDIRRQQSLTKTEAERLLVQFMQMDIWQLEEVLKDKKRKVIEHMIGRIALMAIKNGDHARLNFVMDRLFGRVKEQVEHSIVKPQIVVTRDGKRIEMSPQKIGDGDE